jgi:serine/threonine-protein kinase
MSKLPEIIGPYRILGRLGQGGMGTVYRAEDPRIGRQVAIKTIPFNHDLGAQAEADLMARFVREAQSAGSLSHPNIVTVHFLGQHEGLVYLVMELVDGPSLARLLGDRQKTFDYLELLRGLLRIAHALDYAHASGIIHRDIKPANILISKEGSFKVADFGIAKVITASTLTATGALIGTPKYVPPETVRGSSVTPPSDQYSLGIVAYEVLTNRTPFQAESTEALLFQILMEPPPPVGTFNSSLNPALDTVLRRALAKDPQERYTSCTEFMEELLAATSADYQAPPSQPLDLPPPPSPRPQAAEFPPIPSPFLSQKQRTPLWKPIVYGLLTAILLAVVVVYFIEKSKVSRDGYRVPRSIQTITLPAELSSPPAVDTPPPIVANAGNPHYLDNPRIATGPRRPKAWFRFHYPKRSQLELALLGGNNTYYVGSADENLWAVRDGEVRWGFARSYGRNFSALPDGRVVNGETVLNADGQGGRFRRTPQLPDPMKRIEGFGVGSQTYGALCRSPKFPLDQYCESMAVDGSGTTYLLTASKNLYAYGADGSRRWLAPMPCGASGLMFASEGRVVLGCRGSRSVNAASLVGVQDGKIAWTFRPDSNGEIQIRGARDEWVLAVDRSGTLYFVDTGNPQHMYALSLDGRVVWKYDLGTLTFDGIQMDLRGRLFVSGQDWVDGKYESYLTCLADSVC